MAGLEDFMNIVENSHQKTASAKNTRINGDLLSKLAQELEGEGMESQVVAQDAAAAAAGAGAAGAEAQGNVKPAASSVAGANPAVVGSTEVVAMPQVVAAGGNAAESAAGEMAAPVKPNEGLAISAADGKIVDVNTFGKVPAAAAAAAVNESEMGPEKTAELNRAKEIGSTMADAYISRMEKHAADAQYGEALEYLESRGMLDNYTINDRP